VNYPLAHPAIVETSIEVPETLEAALDLDWLTRALAPVSGNARVIDVAVSGMVRTMASKVRIAVTFDSDPKQLHHYCLKAFLGPDVSSGAGGATTLLEADFYREIAPQLTMRTPQVWAIVTDRVRSRGLLIMSDMIEAGVHFCDALESFSADQVAETLDQIARLHAKSALLENYPWIRSRVQRLADTVPFSAEWIQPKMHDERRGALSDRTLDAGNLIAGIEALAKRNASLPQTMLHGDCHPGNVYWTAEGPGFTDFQLLQRGNWALDVAYHLSSMLPTEVAEREERRLLDHYLSSLRGHGGIAPDPESAWDDYRAAQVYGYYHWAITTRVDPAITHVAFRRLGAGVERHDTYRRLGL